ncbi:MAG: hypothetical protein RL329_1346 [Bacteroidota bacterium]|jgi:hypothetical protein
MTIIENIKRLLASPENDNVELIVELIAGAEVQSPTLLSYLMPIAFKHPDKLVRERALSILTDLASPDLQAHIQTHLKKRVVMSLHHETPFLYAHPELYYFKAVWAEKRMMWHQHQASNNHFPEYESLFFGNAAWENVHHGLEDFDFVHTIWIQKIANFDAPMFMDLIKGFPVHTFTFDQVVLPTLPQAVWDLETLRNLKFVAPKEAKTLVIPKHFSRNIDFLQIQGGYHLIGSEHLLLCAKQFRHLLIAENPAVWKNDF